MEMGRGWDVDKEEEEEEKRIEEGVDTKTRERRGGGDRLGGKGDEIRESRTILLSKESQ
jgi:hypothetical protein